MDALQDQKILLESLIRHAESQNLEIITKEISFANEDVPHFLKRLDEFHGDSLRNCKIITRSYSSPLYN